MINNLKINPVGQYLLLKKFATYIICHSIVGQIIETVFRNKIPHRGSRIEVPRGGDPSLSAGLFWGTYESAEIRYVRDFLDTTIDVVELGSSIGGVSCEIARKLDNNRKLICIEANPRILGVLRSNLAHNAPNKACRVWHGAINYGDESTIQLSVGHNHLSSRLGHEGVVENVPALRLSNILAQESIHKYSLVCDIEGAEVQIFILDKQAFDTCCTLVIELHSIDYKSTHYTPDTLIILIESNSPLSLLGRYGNVCIFKNRNVL